MTKNLTNLKDYLEMYFEDNNMDDFLSDIGLHPVDFVMNCYEAGAIDDIDLLLLLANDDDDVAVSQEL